MKNIIIIYLDLILMLRDCLFEIYVRDDVNPVTEIPSNGSPFTFLRHFKIKII